MTLAQITSPFFTAGFTYDAKADRVTDAAPIIAFMRRWNAQRVRDYCRVRGWSVAIVAQYEM